MQLDLSQKWSKKSKHPHKVNSYYMRCDACGLSAVEIESAGVGCHEPPKKQKPK